MLANYSVYIARKPHWSATQHWKKYVHIKRCSYSNMFIFNPMLHVANMKLGIEFENIDMLKIQSVWNLSSTSGFILSQQRPVLDSAHAQKLSSEVQQKTEQWNTKCSFPQDSYRDDEGCVLNILTKVASEIYYPYLNFVVWPQCEFSFIVGVRVVQSSDKITKIVANLKTQPIFFLQNIL